MKAESFYKSLIAVANFIAQGNNAITEEEGNELAGMYWPRISGLLIEHKVGDTRLGGVLVIIQHRNIYPILADCHNALEEISKAQYDRELDNTMKLSNMKYAKQAYKISIASILIAVAALTWQIISKI